MQRSVTLLIIVAAVALGLWGREKWSQSKTSAATRSTGVLSQGIGKSSSVVTNSSPAVSLSATSLPNANQYRPADSKASLNEMSLVLVDAVRGSKNFEGIVQRLKQTGQDPVITRDGSATTGEMLIVRTKNPLPGTRYFHAQYFTDENNQRFVQHMSFEFQPSATAMADAVNAAVRNFSVGEPTERKADFMQWNLDENYVLWIKKKSVKDLQHDPFNAHDPKKDVGTVQMAVELKIHDDEHEGH